MVREKPRRPGEIRPRVGAHSSRTPPTRQRRPTGVTVCNLRRRFSTS
jgi:hypothetical protein